MARSQPELEPGNGPGDAVPPPEDGEKINTAALPFFRFFAACIVVFFHFAQDITWYPQVPEVFKAGSLMVTFFFVLSGFSLFLGYYRKSFGFGHYLMKRALKILPLYYLAFLISAGTLAFFGKMSLADFFLNLFCLQAWLPYPLTVNFTSWFVSALLFCYCLFPPVLSFLRRVKPAGWIALFVSVLLWAATQWLLIRIMNSDTYDGRHFWSYHLIYYFPPFHFCSFFMGVCGAYCLVTWDMKTCGGGIHSALITLLLLAVVAILVQYEPAVEALAGFRLPFGVSLYAPVMLLLLFHLTLSRNRLLEILAWPKLIVWGEASYALFILQGPLDKVDNYFVSSYYDMGPGIHLILFSLFLLLLSFLAIKADKTVRKWINRESAKTAT
jgi:peptidoglycan/LPS O-acetylase OafA/YrhL